MADVTVAEEEYLQTLYWLYEARLPDRKSTRLNSSHR